MNYKVDINSGQLFPLIFMKELLIIRVKKIKISQQTLSLHEAISFDFVSISFRIKL